MTFLETIGHTTANDWLGMIAGERIGRGMYRDVYATTGTEYVYKVETKDGCFCNVYEWEIWHAASKEVKKWLAPCVDISSNGIVLVQKRVIPIRKLPPRIPHFLTDAKLSNWGEYNGRPVCCDYGNHKLLTDGLWRLRLKTLSQKERTTK